MKRIQSALILYPNQLFKPEIFPQVDMVFVVEEPLFFGTDREWPNQLHKQKLVLHKASMRWYVEQVLWPANIDVEYIELNNLEHTAAPLITAQKMGAEVVYMFDPTDHRIEARFNQALENEIKSPFELRVEPNPSFMLRSGEVRGYFSDKSKNSFEDFYQWQRERFNILIDKKYKPVGGKWIFNESDNKTTAPNHVSLGFNGFGNNEYVVEAKKWVEKNFGNNPGKLDSFFWPTTYEEANEWFDNFIQQRLGEFSSYQNSTNKQGLFLYHSGISALLNIGLLTPQVVVDTALSYYQKNPKSLPSIELFLRKIIGWREYVRGLYVTQSTLVRSTNVLQHNRSLSSDWWQGNLRISPVDTTTQKVITNAYLHNFDRLAVVNFMVLCQIKPDEIYRWFVSLFIDAYDWVVIPNVYSVDKFSESVQFQTQQNVSDSSYILKNSDYEAGDWCDVWDGLFWNFVEKHKGLLTKNHHTKGFVKQLEKIDPDKRRIIGYRAQDFLAKIDS